MRYIARPPFQPCFAALELEAFPSRWTRLALEGAGCGACWPGCPRSGPRRCASRRRWSASSSASRRQPRPRRRRQPGRRRRRRRRWPRPMRPATTKPSVSSVAFSVRLGHMQCALLVTFANGSGLGWLLAVSSEVTVASRLCHLLARAGR